MRGLLVFNTPIGDEDYITYVLKDKARQVEKLAKMYIDDVAEEHPHELWTMLQYSLQHMILYWLRTCTPDETLQMVELVDECIWDEATKAATGVQFKRDAAPMARLK